MITSWKGAGYSSDHPRVRKQKKLLHINIKLINTIKNLSHYKWVKKANNSIQCII